MEETVRTYPMDSGVTVLSASLTDNVKPILMTVLVVRACLGHVLMLLIHTCALVSLALLEQTAI